MAIARFRSTPRSAARAERGIHRAELLEHRRGALRLDAELEPPEAAAGQDRRPDHAGARHRDPDAVGDAAEVHVDHVVPVRGIAVPGLAADADAGVVEEAVEAARRLGHLVHQGAEARGVAHVELARVRRAAFGPDPRGRLLGPGRVASASVTAAPRRASSPASARPIPDPAPVTIALRPAKPGVIGCLLSDPASCRRLAVPR